MHSAARLFLLWRIIITTTTTTATFFSLLVLPCRTQAFYITPPVSQTDWEQLAQLLASESEPNDDSPATVLEKMQWNLWGRRQTQDALYRRYVRNARQLRGAKYAVFVAKQWDKVLGVAEMGKQADCRAVVGVLSVAPAARRQGIGEALVQRCEATAATVWHETCLWVEVETTPSKVASF